MEPQNEKTPLMRGFFALHAWINQALVCRL